MHVSCKKNMNIVVCKYYKVKSLPHSFSTSQVSQPRTTSFLYDLQKNFDIYTSTITHIHFFKRNSVILHITCPSVSCLPSSPTYN